MAPGKGGNKRTTAHQGGRIDWRVYIGLLGFADDLDVIRETLEDEGNVARLLETETRNVGLQINAYKTILIELLWNEEFPEVSEWLIIGKVDDFKYLDAMLSTNNVWAK